MNAENYTKGYFPGEKAPYVFIGHGLPVCQMSFRFDIYMKELQTDRQSYLPRELYASPDY